MKWRIVGLETHDAYFNMALDEAISEGIMNGSSPPTIRFYTWKPGAVSIGYFQSIRDEVNLKTCKELGIDHIRRWTGGGAVYHDTDRRDYLQYYSACQPIPEKYPGIISGDLQLDSKWS